MNKDQNTRRAELIQSSYDDMGTLLQQMLSMSPKQYEERCQNDPAFHYGAKTLSSLLYKVREEAVLREPAGHFPALPIMGDGIKEFDRD